MPVARPQPKVLNLRNIIIVTQGQATSPGHRKAYLEVVRVDGIARNKTGERGDEAKNLLVSLRNELLGKSEQFTIELTHAHLPESYFMSMCPRYMTPPSGSRSVVLRWKIGNTKKMPFSCLELTDENNVFLPWTTVDAKEDGFKKCEKDFKDYTGLVRHLATRHMVLWLSFHCPWCDTLGFEKVKITRHVATCKEMPPAVVALVEAVERGDDQLAIVKLTVAAYPDLKTVDETDKEFQLKRRITLAMTRSEAKWRAHAERSSQKSNKDRWSKSVKPTEMGYNDGTGIYCTSSRKFPKFATCSACQKVYLDTQLASKGHLAQCDLRGFMTYHAQKARDEGILSDVDRKIFRWKSQAEKTVKEQFQPTVTCTVDGYGAASVNRRTRKTLADIMETVEPLAGTNVRVKNIVISEKSTGLTGKLRILGSDEGKLKTELANKALNLPLFKDVAKKRKISVDYGRNMKARCQRRTTPRELFLHSHVEEYQSHLQ